MFCFYLLIIEDDNNKTKFECIYLKYKDLMLNRAYDILHDSILAEDAVHNAFLSILKNLSKIKSVDKKETKGYVIVIVENAAKKIYNHEHKIHTLEYSENEVDVSAEEKYEVKATLQYIKQQINLLPEIYRTVLILKYYNDLDNKEIASVLSIPYETVRKRVLRGKQLLISKIKEYEYNGKN